MTMTPELRSLLQRLDGQLGLAVYRGEHDQRWKDEATTLIHQIRAAIKVDDLEEKDPDLTVRFAIPRYLFLLLDAADGIGATVTFENEEGNLETVTGLLDAHANPDLFEVRDVVEDHVIIATSIENLRDVLVL